MNCTDNSESDFAGFKENKFKSQLDVINELYDFLTGTKLPEGMKCEMPNLSYTHAFNVIWFLQEHMHILPDNIEQCQECLNLYDSHSSGYCLTDEYTLKGKPLPRKYCGHYCDNCVPDIEFGSP